MKKVTSEMLFFEERNFFFVFYWIQKILIGPDFNLKNRFKSGLSFNLIEKKLPDLYLR